MGEAGAGATRVALTMCTYGLFLAVCGYYGAWSRGMDPKAMHSLYMGAGGGGAMALCGLLSSRSSRYAAAAAAIKACAVVSSSAATAAIETLVRSFPGGLPPLR
jgi:hypothetical protein